MSVALSSSLYCEIGDFVTWDKARNAFLTEDFSPRIREFTNYISFAIENVSFFVQKQQKDNTNAHFDTCFS